MGSMYATMLNEHSSLYTHVGAYQKPAGSHSESQYARETHHTTVVWPLREQSVYTM